MITIIDYQMGNLGSIANTFNRMNIPVKISSDVDEITTAEKLILPGVGSFDQGMERLTKMGLLEAILHAVLENDAIILGICLGMQMFFSDSMEGKLKGIGLIDGRVVRFDKSKIPNRHKIPHMGWNTLHNIKPNLVIDGIHENERFYFAHSYHADGVSPENIIADSEYGYSFPAVISKKNIFGIQFHPERSHIAGQKILRNFSVL